MLCSVNNPKIKRIVGLRKASERKQHGLFIVDGAREIVRAIKCEMDMVEIYYCKEYLRDDLGNIFGKDLKFIHSKGYDVSTKVYDKISFGNRKDGLLAVFRAKNKLLADIKVSKQSIILVADSVEKPGNIGALLRTADAAGIDALILANVLADMYNPNIIRASTGTVFSVPWASGTREEVFDFLNKNNFTIFGAYPSARRNYIDIKFNRATAFILGNEDQGLNSFWEQTDIQKIKIEMKGLADSLNVSVSAAVLIFEAIRQNSK